MTEALRVRKQEAEIVGKNFFKPTEIVNLFDPSFTYEHLERITLKWLLKKYEDSRIEKFIFDMDTDSVKSLDVYIDIMEENNYAFYALKLRTLLDKTVVS